MNCRLAPDQHLVWLSSNFDSLVAAASSAPATDVPECPGWTCVDVIEHVMLGLPVYAAFLEIDPHTDPIEAVLAEAAATLEWRTGVDDVLGAAHGQFDRFNALARGLDPDSACLFWDGPGTAAKMFWHAATESWIHTSDVTRALGDTATLSTDQAADLFEWSIMFRRMVCAGRGLDADSTVVLETTDTSQRTTLGSGEPTELARGSATALSLRLWNRSPGEVIDGDGAALSAWADVALTSPLG